MLQRLFMIVFVIGFGWLLRRLLGAAAAAAPGSNQRPRGAPPEPTGGEMVRDRVCNTFLPRASALTSHADGKEHFFCSERCRRSFLESA